MQADPKTPFSVTFCNLLIRIAAQLVPSVQRQEWEQEWVAEICHRWLFLFHAGLWSRREAFSLLRNCLGAFPDAAWHFALQDAVQTRLRESVRSPWVCLGALTVLLLIVAAASSGLSATRGLLFSHSNQSSGRLVFIWLHPITGEGDKGLPPDVAPPWAANSRLLQGVAGFTGRHAWLSAPGVAPWKSLVVKTEPALFHVLQARPALGAFSPNGVVLDHRTWISRFHANPGVIGSQVALDGMSYKISAVLPGGFQFLSRQPSIYLVQEDLTDRRVMVIARAVPGATEEMLNRDLRTIAENVTYYFFGSDLRFGFLDSELLTPLRFFCVAVLAAAIMLLTVCRVRTRHIKIALQSANIRGTGLRAAFFLSKTSLALALVFVAGLEWSRSKSSVLMASQDPATGPFLLWLYILGAMGVLFWSSADQRARCRVCLRLLCFPVRIGCPGCLLLDWSGTELACAEGHGLLHVPHMAPSWDEESEHWISLDDSWRELFAHTEPRG
ncbi:MAG: ABC transporter permease [Bryobacteraceae bacterium]